MTEGIIIGIAIGISVAWLWHFLVYGRPNKYMGTWEASDVIPAKSTK